MGGALRLADHFVVRAGALPYRALDDLKNAAAAGVAARLDGVDAELAGLGARLADMLAGRIGGCADAAVRRRLLALRRSVHNQRPYRDLDAALAALEPPLAAAVRTWAGLLDRADRLAADGERLLDAAAPVAGLATAWREPLVRRGLRFAQPRLHRTLATLAAGGRADRDALAKARLSAPAYLYRAATKASPFSGLGIVGVGWLDGAPAPCAVRLGRTEARTHVKAALVDRIARHLADEPFAHRAPLVLNPSCLADGGEVVFVRVEDDTETLARLDASPALAAVCAALAASPAGRTHADLLGDLLGDAAGLPYPADKLDAYLRRLRRWRLLVPAIDQAAPGADLIDRLAGGPLLAGDEAAPHRDRVTALATAAGQDGIERAAAEAASWPGGGGADPLHDQVYAVPASRAGRAAIAPIEADLARLCGPLPLFNVDFAAHDMVQAFALECVTRAGGPVPLLRVFRELCERGGDGDPYARDPFALAAKQAPNLPALERDRDAFAAQLRALVGTGPLELPAAFLGEWARRAEPHRPRLAGASVGVTGHLADLGRPGPADGFSFVLNGFMPGYGALVSRFLGPRRERGAWEPLPAALARYRGRVAGGATPVDLDATLGFDGQLHLRVSDERLVYPGDPVPPAGPAPLRWSDLVVGGNGAGRAVLRHAPTRRTLLPMHHGSLAPAHFPPFYRTVLAFGPSFTPSLSLPDLLAGDGLAHLPRITAGRVVVLRETWIVGADEVPRRDRSEPAFAFFRRMRAWARERDLPRRVFVTPMRVPDYLAGDDPGPSFRRVRKPFYVDWDDPVCAELVQRFTAASRRRVTITEMLPLPEQVPGYSPAGARPTEHLFEFYE